MPGALALQYQQESTVVVESTGCRPAHPEYSIGLAPHDAAAVVAALSTQSGAFPELFGRLSGSLFPYSTNDFERSIC